MDKGYSAEHFQELHENEVGIFVHALELVDDGHHGKHECLLLRLVGKSELRYQRQHVLGGTEGHSAMLLLEFVVDFL